VLIGKQNFQSTPLPQISMLNEPRTEGVENIIWCQIIAMYAS